MIRIALLALVLLASGQSCDLGGVAIDAFAVNWRVVVINSGTDPAAITATVGDVTETHTVAPRDSITVESFTGGTWKVSIVDNKARKTFLEERLREWQQGLAIHSDLGFVGCQGPCLDDLIARIASLSAQIATAGDEVIGSASCSGAMPDRRGASQIVSATQDRSTSVWVCT